MYYGVECKMYMNVKSNRRLDLSVLRFQLLQGRFTQTLRVLSSPCSAARGVFLQVLEEIWPHLFLFLEASVLGIAKSIQEPKKWPFTDRNEGGLMGCVGEGAR